MLKNERAPPAATERGSKTKQSGAKNTPSLSVVSSVPLDDFEIADSPLSLVPPGTYSVCYIGHWTGVMFQKQPKLALNFKVVSVGEHFGATLSRWYNAKRLMGHHGTSGRFQVGRRSDLLAEFMLLNAASKAPARLDRLSFANLRNLVITARVDTVTQNYKQRSISTQLQYSVIRELLGIELGATHDRA